MDNITAAIFAPRNGTVLKRNYPELAENKKFKDISSEELTWVWHYACESSDLVKDENLTQKQRAIKAADLAFTAGTPTSKEAKKKFADLNIPERIKEAVDEMRKYKPSARELAATIIQTSFINLYNMAAVKNEDFIEIDADGHQKINFTARKQYVETVAKISETLPELIKQMEHNFGVEKKEDKSASKLIDKYHERKKE